MKRREFLEIKKMNIGEILEKARALKSEIAGLHLDKGMGKLSNLKVIKNKRQALARMLTVVRQKQILEALEDKNG